MGKRLRGLMAQEVVGTGAVLLGALSFLLSWRLEAPGVLTLARLMLAACLATGLILAYHFPIHLRPHTKVCVGSIPLYLMAALLPPPLAMAATGLGLTAANMNVRSRHALPPSAIATDVGRWTVLICVASWVAHANLGSGVLHPALLTIAAAFLWAGDMLTAALLFAPLRTSRRFARLIAAMMRDGGPVEAGQYLVALLGAVVSAPGLWALLLLVPPAALLYKITKHTKEMQDGTRQLLERMADTVDLRDPYTGGHSRRVAELCAGILRALPLRGPEAALIISAARVHDIGKLGIPDAVLLKDGRLTDEESAIMRTHPVRGADLLAQYPDFARGADIVRHHHERWDGKGYPDGLDGTDIPLGARVIAVADSFDAMTTDRPYRAGIPVQGAAAILREGSGTEWEPVIVQAFLRSIADRLEEAQSGTPTEASVPSISTTLLVSPLTEGLDLICRDEPLHQILEQPDQDLPMRRWKAQTWS